MSERKTALTFGEKLTVAFMHYVRHIDQQDLAMLYGVNIGRVSEACNTLRKALMSQYDATYADAKRLYTFILPEDDHYG